VITIEVVALPAGFVTVATVWFVIVCPAFAGAARRSAATEVVTRREVVKREWRDGGRSAVARSFAPRVVEDEIIG
jgi:hypothetical protein